MCLALKGQLSEVQKKSLCAQTFLLFQQYELLSQKIMPLSTNLVAEQKSASTESAKKEESKRKEKQNQTKPQ